MRSLAQPFCDVWSRAIRGNRRMGLFVMVPFFLSANVSAQELIKISQSAWLALAPSERAVIQQKHIVELVEQNTFGTIIDNQGVNESTAGTNGGAVLGGAFANAAYVDNAIKGGNYSAKNQLAAGILGAVLGSTLDSKPNAQYHYRYAVKLESGDIKYFDETKSDPFRHPVGVCVSVPDIALIEQQLCTQTATVLRTTYLHISATQAIDNMQSAHSITGEKSVAKGVALDAGSPPTYINCKLGTLAPVRTSVEKCALINGSQVQ